MQNGFSGRTAVVTGASSGIGRATARALAAAGARVIAAARRAERLEEMARGNKNIVPVAQDVTRDLAPLAKAVGSGPVDILVNAAGLAWGRESVQEMPGKKWETMLDVNVKGLIAVTQLLLPRMIAAGRGDIVHVGSVAGFDFYAGGGGYCPTKAAVRAFADCLRHDVLGTGVRVIGIHPGMVETEFSLVRFDGDAEKACKVYEGMTPLAAEDVAETILWTLSRPAHVTVSSLTLLATDQADATRVYRRATS